MPSKVRQKNWFLGIWTCLCGRVVSIIHLSTLILTCLWTSGQVLTKALSMSPVSLRVFGHTGWTYTLRNETILCAIYYWSVTLKSWRVGLFRKLRVQNM